MNPNFLENAQRKIHQAERNARLSANQRCGLIAGALVNITIAVIFTFIGLQQVTWVPMAVPFEMAGAWFLAVLTALAAYALLRHAWRE